MLTKNRVGVVLAALTVSLFIFSLSLGGADISWQDIIKFASGGEIDEIKETILLEIRLPRVIMAFLIGMLLASSGVVVQSVFLNPLADPYIIGIASAATFGAVAAYLLKLPDFYYGVFAFFSAAILSVLIFKLSKKGKSIATLLIIGIAFSSFLGAFTSFATYLIGEDSFKIVAWMMGYIGAASWLKVSILIVPLVISIMYFYLKRHELDLLLSGDEEAHSLGLNVGKLKKNMLIVSSLIVGFSVAFTGMIGFVGLIVPHIMRSIIGPLNARLIPFVLIYGGIFLLICDTFGRIILAPVEIPIGVITSILGAPFFLYLALKRSRRK